MCMGVFVHVCVHIREREAGGERDEMPKRTNTIHHRFQHNCGKAARGNEQT